MTILWMTFKRQHSRVYYNRVYCFSFMLENKIYFRIFTNKIKRLIAFLYIYCIKQVFKSSKLLKCTSIFYNLYKNKHTCIPVQYKNMDTSIQGLDRDMSWKNHNGQFIIIQDSSMSQLWQTIIYFGIDYKYV